VYPNGTDTTYWWEYGATTSYGQQTKAIDIGSGTAPVSVTDALSGLQANTTYHYRLVAQNTYGTEYGYDFTLSTAGATTSSSEPGSGGSNTQTTPTQVTTPVTTPPSTVGAPSAGASSSPPATPLVARLRVSSAGARTATVTAGVATGGAASSYSLEYGTTPALRRSLKGSLAVSSTRLSGTLRHLAPGRTYYLRAVITNSAGSSATEVIRFRTSPVTITRLTLRAGGLQAALRCYGSAPCRVKLQARSGSRLVFTTQATIRSGRTTTVSLPVSRSQGAVLKLIAQSSWNGYPAAVTATV
jgi:hypothetical protein